MSASFRDPAGRVLRSAGRILRAVKPDSAAELEAFLATRAAREALDHGKLVRSARIPFEKVAELQLAGEVLFEHERIPFASYPHEWTSEMLAAAGALTLELFQSALQEGFGLKDATLQCSVSWSAAGIRRCTLIRASTGAGRNLDGLLAVRAHVPVAACGPSAFRTGSRGCFRRSARRPGSLHAVPMGRILETARPAFSELGDDAPVASRPGYDEKSYHSKPAPSPEQARFILDHLVRSCERQLKKVAPRANESAWTSYSESQIPVLARAAGSEGTICTRNLGVGRTADGTGCWSQRGPVQLAGSAKGSLGGGNR